MTHRRQPDRRSREAGQSPVMAVLVLAAIAVVAAIFVTGKLAVATQDKGEAQHGADAAALAGAQAVLDEIPTDVLPGFLTPAEIPELLGGSRCLQTGYPEASRLAAANGGSLAPADYCYNAFTDEVSVAVTGDGARAEATAATSLEADRCELDPGFTPPTEDPEPADDDDASPPPPVRTLISCGDVADLVVTFNPVDSRFHFVEPALTLALTDVKPRLTR